MFTYGGLVGLHVAGHSVLGPLRTVIPLEMPVCSAFGTLVVGCAKVFADSSVHVYTFCHNQSAEG